MILSLSLITHSSYLYLFRMGGLWLFAVYSSSDYFGWVTFLQHLYRMKFACKQFKINRLIIFLLLKSVWLVKCDLGSNFKQILQLRVSQWINLITVKYIIDVNVNCYLQTWVDIVSSSTAYLNILFNFPEKATSCVIDYYYQTCFVLHAALLFHLAIPCIED